MNFSQLKRLISVIEDDQPRFFCQFDTVLTSEKYLHLKKGLQACKAEEELVVYLYGELNTGAYSKLKGRFTDQLLDVFLLSKCSSLKSYTGTVLSKYWQLTLLFKSMGQLDLSKIFALKGLRIAERKKKYKQAFKFADFLKSYHILMKWDLSSYRNMETKAREFLKLFNDEQQLKDIYFSLSYQLSIQRVSSKKQDLLVDESYNTLPQPNTRGKYASFYYHSSIVLKGILERNYQLALDYIDHVYAEINTLNSKSELRLLENMIILKVQIYLHINEYSKAWRGIKNLETSVNIIESGRIVFLKIRVLLKLKRYQEAFVLFKDFFPKLKKIPNLELPFVEGFYLVHGLFFALYKLREIDCNAQYFKSFRYYKWLNSLPIYAKDKLGMNISVLVIDFLIGKTEGWANTYAKAEQLDLYRYRYLKQEAAYDSISYLFKLFKEYAKHKMDDDVLEVLNSKIEFMPSMDSNNLSLYFSEMELLPWEEFAKLGLKNT